MPQKRAIYPGSFDPFTNGHKAVVTEALEIFDLVRIVIAKNPSKDGMFTERERAEMIGEIFPNEIFGNGRLEVVSWGGLVAQYARTYGFTHIIRGLRDASDFLYEMNMSGTNELVVAKKAPFERPIKTVFIPVHGAESYYSSSVAKALVKSGGDLSQIVSPNVANALIGKLKNN